MTQFEKHNREAKQGQFIALVLIVTGVFWIIATFLGQTFGVSNRIHALFDLVALAGFGFALWSVFQLWRSRQNDGEGKS